MKHLIATFFLVGSSALLAQDPGYAPAAAPSSRAQAPVAYNSPNSMSAAGLNDMSVLDNTRPIRPGDLLSIRVVEDRKPAEQKEVDVTGNIQAPYVGLIQAAGKTSRQLAEELKAKLEGAYFRVATVIVAIDRSREDEIRGYRQDMHFFTVFGQVIRQGKYELPLDEDVTISQAILRAGGFAQFANTKKVKLVRDTPSGNKTILVNCDDIMRRGALEKDVYIRNGDVVIVIEKNVNF